MCELFYCKQCLGREATTFESQVEKHHMNLSWNLPLTPTSCQLFSKREYFPDSVCSMCILKRFTCMALTLRDGRWFQRSRWFCTTLCRMNMIHLFLKHKCNNSDCLPGHSIPSHFNIFLEWFHVCICILIELY